MHRLLCVFTVMLCLHGCGENTQAVHPVQTQFSKSSGLTVIADQGKSQQLIAESLDARPVISPSGQWIAVEDMQMSNLVVVRLFRYQDGGYEEIDRPEIRRNWEALAQQSGIAFEDLLHPRVGIESFGPSERTLLLRFQAEAESTGNREIDSVVTITLE